MYLAIALLAALVTVWLALQMLGALVKLVFIAAALLVAWAAIRAVRYS